MSKKVFIDYERCIGCKACEVACEREHGESMIKVFQFPDLTNVSFNCRHCENAPCVNVCPVNALSHDADGAVVIDPLRCIGCSMCVLACPFGVPKINELNKVMVKCDLCADRRAEGKLPACVTSCPTEALKFGEMDDISLVKEETVVSGLVGR